MFQHFIATKQQGLNIREEERERERQREREREREGGNIYIQTYV